MTSKGNGIALLMMLYIIVGIMAFTVIAFSSSWEMALSIYIAFYANNRLRTLSAKMDNLQGIGGRR